MAIDKVRAYFEAFGMAGRILEFDAGTATVAEAAAAVGCAGQRIAKTLSFRLAGGCALIVAAGDAKVDNAKYKARFGVKATMLSPDEAIAMTGHAIGGVCPFAIPESVPVHLDVSLKRFRTVFVACGSANSVIEMTIPELERYSNTAGWVDVCKAWQ
ncbi:MAG: YbaK/EbsC family protein [Candidatus Accumulibacter sp.]|nr:YbaK/EbsC family protein [Accumulibacter sp.]